MDFIEHYFGVDPDAGSGLLELLYIVIVLVVVLALVFRRYLLGLVRRFLGR
jgi:hypothetical protein